MSEIIRKILFYLVVLLSNIIQCITGFAGTVLAMPFSILLVGYDVAKPILNILGILASIGVVAFNYKKINWKEFLKITLIMLPGMAIGFILIKFLNISKEVLYIILATVVFIFTGIGIYTNFIKKDRKVLKNIVVDILMYVLIAVAGTVHGMFVCGGPLLIIYASRKLTDRDEFRATLSMSWVVLNSIIMVLDIANGYFNADVLPNMLITLAIASACLVASLIIGDKVAKKLNRNVFMIITYILMAISALSLILNVCGVI